MAEIYLEDLAYIHDAGFAHVARAGAEMLVKLLRGKPHGLIVDLGAGSGVLAERLSAAGHDVLGFDVSPAMLEIARRRAPRATFRCQSLVDAEMPTCQAVVSVGECLNYATARSRTSGRLAALFRRIYAALRPQGRFLFDVATVGRVRGHGPQRRFFEGEDWAVLVETEEDRARCKLERRITSFRRVGKYYRRSFEEHVQNLFDRAELAELLRSTGFQVRTSRAYGKLKFPPGAIAFLATKI